MPALGRPGGGAEQGDVEEKRETETVSMEEKGERNGKEVTAGSVDHQGPEGWKGSGVIHQDQ